MEHPFASELLSVSVNAKFIDMTVCGCVHVSMSSLFDTQPSSVVLADFLGGVGLAGFIGS